MIWSTSLYRLCSAIRSGVSARHGPHHVAQKFSSTTFPRAASSVTGFPSSPSSLNSGAASGCPTSRITGKLSLACNLAARGRAQSVTVPAKIRPKPIQVFRRRMLYMIAPLCRFSLSIAAKMPFLSEPVRGGCLCPPRRQEKSVLRRFLFDGCQRGGASSRIPGPGLQECRYNPGFKLHVEAALTADFYHCGLEFLFRLCGLQPGLHPRGKRRIHQLQIGKRILVNQHFGFRQSSLCFC